MNLYISDQPGDPITGTQIHPNLLNNRAAHLVIASVKWQEAWVDVVDEISEGCLTHLNEKCNVIHARVPDHPSRHQMVLLCELYPDLAGSIRKAFMKGESVNAILPSVWRPGDAPGWDPLSVPVTG